MVSINPLRSKFPKRPWQHLYDRQFWRGPNGLRAFILRRDPVCVICDRNPSTIADHIKDHKGNWDLFRDDKNIRGVCKACHDERTARESGGFGNPHRNAPVDAPAATGAPGKQFTASSLKAGKLDKALDFDVSSLLEGIPE